MSLIKISELADGALSGGNYIAHADVDGIAYKVDLDGLSDYLGVSSSISFKGSLAIADTPTEDGWYFATETGTYTNAGSLVVSIADNLAIIIVADTVTTFSLVNIPLTIALATVLDPVDTTEALTGKAAADYFGINTDLDTTDKTTHVAAINEVNTASLDAQALAIIFSTP